MTVTEAPPLEDQERVAEGDGVPKEGIEVPADGSEHELVVPEAEEEPAEPTATDLRKAAAGPEALSLPQIDGQDVDRIELNFSGSVRLDRSDPADVALFRALRLGQQVDVRVAGVAAGKDGRVSYDEDGYPGETTAKAKIKVTTVFRPVGDGAVARVGSDQTELVEE